MSQFVPIDLDKVRNLRIGIKASKIIQDELKKPLMEALNDFVEKFDINTLVWITYAGLVHEDEKLTFDKVLDLIDEHSTIEEVTEKLNKAIEIGFARKNNKKQVGK